MVCSQHFTGALLGALLGRKRCKARLSVNFGLNTIENITKENANNLLRTPVWTLVLVGGAVSAMIGVVEESPL